MSLHGKVAVVTGGNSGIGKAVVLALAAAGANIVIDFVAHPEATEELEKQVHALGDQAIGVQADVSKEIEQLTGRKVIGFMSDNHIDPDLAVEVFILEPQPPDAHERRR